MPLIDIGSETFDAVNVYTSSNLKSTEFGKVMILLSPAKGTLPSSMNVYPVSGKLVAVILSEFFIVIDKGDVGANFIVVIFSFFISEESQLRSKYSNSDTETKPPVEGFST